MSFGDLDLQGHSTNFSLVKTEVVLGQVHQPISRLTMPWNNFMVHNVHRPLGVVYIIDHKVVTCPRPFFHGHTFMVQFFKNAILKPLGLH